MILHIPKNHKDKLLFVGFCNRNEYDLYDCYYFTKSSNPIIINSYFTFSLIISIFVYIHSVQKVRHFLLVRQITINFLLPKTGSFGICVFLKRISTILRIFKNGFPFNLFYKVNIKFLLYSVLELGLIE